MKITQLISPPIISNHHHPVLLSKRNDTLLIMTTTSTSTPSTTNPSSPFSPFSTTTNNNNNNTINNNNQNSGQSTMTNGDYNMSGAQVLLAYLQQSTRVGMRQLQQLGRDMTLHLPPASPPLLILALLPGKMTTST